MRGFSRGEEIRYNEIRLSFVLFHDERKEGDEVPFFRKKKQRERAIFFAHTHAKELSNSSHINNRRHGCSSSRYIFVLATNMFTLSTSATVSSVSLSRLLSRARCPGLGFFFFFEIFSLSPS